MRYRDLQSAFGLMSTLDTVGRVLFSLVALLATLRVSVGVYAWHVTNKLERPAYTVVRTLSDGVELRRYEPYLIAQTSVASGGIKDGTGEGFKTVAGYIFGKNKARRGRGADQMSMTAPVRTSATDTVQLPISPICHTPVFPISHGFNHCFRFFSPRRRPSR